MEPFSGEYIAADRQWDFFCPIWPPGRLSRLLSWPIAFSETRFATAAKRGAEFIGNNRISDPDRDDYGLILGFEDVGDGVNTSAVFWSHLTVFLLERSHRR